jgi:peptidase M48-like protein
MNSRPPRFAGWITLVVILLTSTYLFGEIPFRKKDKDAPPRTSDQPPELTENDKKKMAEIADRPEVKDEIQAAWDAKRRDDLEFAYNVNNSVHFGDISGPQWAQFREKYGQLYNNPILQQYLNNIGQRLVPRDSLNVYSFKLLLDPLPIAESYSTGSVYISTGLVALLDNEAQLAYVLGHEIAHVEKNHFYNAIRNGILEQELNKERAKETEKKRAIFSAVATGVGAGIGGIAGGGRGAVAGAFIGLGGGYVSSFLLFRTKTTNTDWSAVDENEADEAGFKYMLDQNYDVREVPRLYVRLENIVTRDARVGLGFVGRPSRVKERSANVQNLLSGAYKAQLDAKLKAAGLIGSTPEFPLLMSALRRDNGIIALDYDLFAMARDNLEQAVSLRSNDARAQLYLGKVIAATARTPAEHQEGLAHFLKAIEYDEGRGAYPDPHLERALSLIAENKSVDWDEIRKELQTYVALYQREHMGQLPNNMPILYDYFTLAGDNNWYVPPVAVVSTKNVEALRVNTSGEMAAASAKAVANMATGAASQAPVPTKTPAARSKPKTVTVSTPH